MHSVVFNVLQAQGPTIPMWVPLVGGFPINSPLVGSFLGVFLAFVVNWIWHTWDSKHLNFEEEYHIKAELCGIKHEQEIGGRVNPIKPVYGADHVRKYRLFGEHRTEVIYWYENFQKYNFELEELREQRQEALNNHDAQTALDLAGQIKIGRDSLAGLIGGMLTSHWLKRIPDDMNNSGLSRTKFVWYWFRLDAPEEPAQKWWWLKESRRLLKKYGQKQKQKIEKSLKPYLQRIKTWFLKNDSNITATALQIATFLICFVLSSYALATIFMHQ